MKSILERITAILIMVCMMFSHTSVFSAWDGYAESDNDDGRKVIVDMDSFQTIAASGAGATIDYKKSSQYSALWLPESKKIINFKENIPADWTEYRSVQWWMYSSGIKKTQFVFLVYPSSGNVYFVYTISVDWEGWKLIDIPLTEFSGTANEWNDISYIAFNASGWGSYVEEGTELAIDDIVLKKADSKVFGTMEERYDESTRDKYLSYVSDIVALYDGTATVLANGKLGKIDKENIYIKTKVVNGNTMVPYEFFDNYLKTDTRNVNGKYTISYGKNKVEFAKDNDALIINKESVKAKAVPFESDGKLYVPAAQIAKGLGLYTDKTDRLSVFSEEENNALHEQNLEEIVSYAASYYNSKQDEITDCDFKQLAENWREYYVGNEENDLSNEHVAARVAEISETGYNLMTTMTREPKVRNLWGTNDIEITNAMSLLYGKIESMALAYGTYGSDYYMDDKMKDAVLYALEWGYNNLYGPNEMQGKGWRDTTAYNWWDWRIGVPRYLLNTIFIMGDAIPEEDVQKYVATVSRFGQKPVSVGSNRLNGCYVQAGIAILTKEAKKLKEARDGMDDTVWYNDGGEGMNTDGSYIYHGKHPMNGAYGTEQIDMISPLICILNNTKFEVTGLFEKNIAEWFDIAYEPFFYNGSFMSMVAGRGTLTNDKSIAATVMKSYVRMLDLFDEKQRPVVESFIKGQLQNSNSFYSYSPTVGEINRVTKIMDDESILPRTEYYLNKVYYNMDRVVQHSEDYSAGVAMSSSRIYNYESINNQNSKGWYIGDGMLYVYTKGRTSFDPLFWTVSDPYKRPGTTVDTQERQALQITNAYLSDEDFVGGVSDGKHGVAAMKLDSYSKYETEGIESTDYGVESPLHDCTLEAQKSWFLFDDEIVALGSAVNAKDGYPVLTVLDNRQAETSKSVSSGDAEAYQIKSVYASAEPQGDNPAAHAIDGTLDTRWSAEGEVYIDLDLGEVKPVGYAGIAIYNGDQRIQYLDIKISKDGKSWNTVYEGQSSGKTKDIELYDLKSSEARYIRVCGHEQNTGSWNSFTEICVYPQVDAELLKTASADYITDDSIIVDNSPIAFGPDETKQFTGAKWLYTENCGGWYFPDEQTLSIKTTNTSRVFVESWLEHGVSPTNGMYSYVQLPDFTARETAEYTQNPDVEIIANDAALQAVREKTLGKTGMVFWRQGSCENITVSAPLIVMVEENSESIILNISDPTHKLNKAAVNVSGAGLKLAEADEAATVTTNETGAKIELDLEESRGKTCSVKLSK